MVRLRSYINKKIGGYDQCKNITITGGTWDGNANGSKDADCIYIGHAQNVVITDTTVKNNSGAHVIELAGVKNAIIENVELYGYKKCKENESKIAKRLLNNKKNLFYNVYNLMT